VLRLVFETAHVERMPLLMKRSQGFTLIEIAIVLIIITLISGGLISFFNIQLTNQRITSTKANEVAIKIALTNFIAQNNRLPCPAIPNLAPGAAGYGREATATASACTGLTPNGAVVTGIVPWISMGISSDAASDGYYNRFTYQVVLAATSTSLTPQTVSGISGAISLHSSGPGVLGAPPTGNQSNACGSGLPNPCAAVAMLVSHGRNGYGAYSNQGIQQTAAIGPDEQENTNGDSRFVVKDFSDSPTNPFDDIVLAMTPNDLLSPLVQGGVLKDFRAVLKDDFEVIKMAIIANAILNRYSSPYNYPLPSSPLPSYWLTPTDPWGRQIQYVVITPTISSGTSSGNAFSLTSSGPDGIVGTSDDIVVTISNVEALALITRVS
jgi:prepilin-type N-terminal cleavage/methylation domain-containing protein